jgi:hypothetical protein
MTPRFVHTRSLLCVTYRHLWGFRLLTSANWLEWAIETNGSKEDHRPVDWRERCTGWACVLVFVCSVTAAVTYHGSGPRAATVAVREAPTTSRPRTTTTSTTLTTSTLELTAGIAPPDTDASSPTPAPPASAPSTVPAEDEPSAPLASAGLYSFDRATGAITRLGDVTNFDAVGNTVEFVSSMSVYRMTPGGGGASLVYTLPDLVGDLGFAAGWDIDRSRESIGWFEASGDGHAVVATGAPIVSSAGIENGRVSRIFVLDPAGHPLVELQSAEAEWSRDGSLLAVADYQGLWVYRSDGTPVLGPIDSGGTLRYLRWRPDNAGILATRNQDGAIVDYTIASNTWNSIDALMITADVGPDGRIIGNRRLTPDMTDADFGTVILDSRSGSVTDFARGTSSPRWSPDGSAVTLSGPLSSRPVAAPRYGLRVMAMDVSVERVLQPAEGLRIALEPPPMVALQGPRWTADSRFVVFNVIPG